MTQNKKKGIAKKALSISLVAAMLATSNVPAWASGFEAMDEPQVLEDTVATSESDMPVMAAGVINQGDLTIDVKIDQKSVVWGEGVTVSGSITKKDGGEEFTGYNFGWRVQGTQEALVSGTVNSAVSEMGITKTTEAMAGKTMELYIWADNENAQFGIIPLGTVEVEKQKIEDDAVTVTGLDALTYNGFVQNGENCTVVVKVNSETLTVDEDYTINSTSATNAGEKVTVSVTAKDDSAYTGTVTKTGEIGKRTYTAKDIVAKVKDNVTYQYTGEEITLKNTDVTLTEDLKDAEGIANGIDLSAVVKEVKADGTSVGKVDATVTVDADALTNYTGVSDIATTDGKVEITARDLSKTDISLANNEVETGTTVSALALVFKDGDTTLNLAASDYAVVVKDSAGKTVTKFETTGTYTVEVNAVGDNTTGSKTLTVKAEQNVLQSASGDKFASYEKEYTGAAIQPTKTDIGKLTVNGTAGEEKLDSSEWTIVGYKNNKDAGTTKNPDAYVTVKILSGKYKDKSIDIAFTIEPRIVKAEDITVPKTITYNDTYVDAKDYKVPVSVVAKDADGKNPITLSSSDYKVTYEYENTGNGNKLGNTIVTKVTITNTNFNGNTAAIAAATKTKISDPALADSMIKVNPSSYTYTGGTILPTFSVYDGVIELYEDVEYAVESITDAVNVGTGTITIVGVPTYYSGTAKATFTITPANTSSVKVKITDQSYTGKQVRPRMSDITITLNGNDVTKQFEIASYGENKAAGTGTVVLKPVAGNKNFTGSDITATFNIVSEVVKADLKVLDAYGLDVTSDYTANSGAPTKTFDFDGTAKTFASAKLENITKDPSGKTKATAADFEIKYVDNVAGKSITKQSYNTAYIYAVAKDGTGYAGKDTITTADGTVIKNVVAKMAFGITAVEFVAKNVTVKNGVYAGGMPVKPQVIVQIGGNTLVEGKDFKLDYPAQTEVTNGKPYKVTVTGINGYAGSTAPDLEWGIDKKSLADCTVTVKNGIVTVMNGSVVVPANEYTTTDNGDGTVTVVASATSKNYTGSKTVAGGQSDKPSATAVEVTGRSTNSVSLSWETCDDAEGYTVWYKASGETSLTRATVTTKTKTTVKGLKPGVKYYFMVKSWIKGSNGYVFSDASKSVRGTTKPQAAKITSVKVNANGDVKVKLAGKAAGAEKYAMCYSKNSNFKDFTVGIRTSYTTRTMAEGLSAGTYYAKVRSYVDLGSSKVYGDWSNAVKFVVK